jgi:hypothetical protein
MESKDIDLIPVDEPVICITGFFRTFVPPDLPVQD